MSRPRTWPRRAVASFLVAVLIFVVVHGIVFVPPNPSRAAANWDANPGGLLPFAAVELLVFGLPLWAAVHLGSAWLRSGRGRP